MPSDNFNTSEVVHLMVTISPLVRENNEITGETWLGDGRQPWRGETCLHHGSRAPIGHGGWGMVPSQALLMNFSIPQAHQ